MEIASGFNLTNGLTTEKVSLPDEIQNMNIPKQSLSDLLTKSLTQTNGSLTSVNSPHFVGKRSVDSSLFDTPENKTNGDDSSSGVDIVKRSDNEMKDQDDSSNVSMMETTTTPTDDPAETDVNNHFVMKRSVDQDMSDENKNNTEGFNSTESLDSKVTKRSIEEDNSKSDDSKDTNDKSSEEISTTDSYIMKRYVDPQNDDEDDDSKSSESDDDDGQTYQHILKRSVEIEKNIDNDGSSSAEEKNSYNTGEFETTTPSNQNTIKRSVDSDEDDDSSITMEDDDEEVINIY